VANPEHLKILRGEIRSWNRWRNENPNIQPDLRGADLTGMLLRRLNLRGADLSGANVSRIDLPGADFRGADLCGTILSGANLSHGRLSNVNFCRADLSKTDLSEADLSGANLTSANLNWAGVRHTDLRRASLQRANLSEADLWGANLEEAVLTDANLNYCCLVQSNLTGAVLTGAMLWGSARDDWQIKGVKCEYVYWDEEGKQRSPKDRDLEPGEFERLYASLPTIEYLFEHGMSPIDPLIMDRIVLAIRERRPEFDIKIDSINARGLAPSIKFTVQHEEDKEPALEEIQSEYELKIKQLESERDHYYRLISRALDAPERDRLTQAQQSSFMAALGPSQKYMKHLQTENDRLFSLLARAMDNNRLYSLLLGQAISKVGDVIDAGTGSIVLTRGSTINIEYIHNAVELQKAIAKEPAESKSFAKVAKNKALDIIGKVLEDIAKGQVKEAAKQIIELGKDLGPLIAKTAAYAFFRSLM